MKTCTVCKKTLDYSHFHNSKVSKDGYGYRCRQCDKDARAKYRETNRERFYMVSRKKTLRHRFGLTLEAYSDLLKRQGNCCAICKSKENSTRGDRKHWNFSVDHCHETGEIRGLLCNNCNRGLGLLGDTKESLRKALDYLEKKETH